MVTELLDPAILASDSALAEIAHTAFVQHQVRVFVKKGKDPTLRRILAVDRNDGVLAPR
jgi:hypothetical protein